jgi:hypothetical protein
MPAALKKRYEQAKYEGLRKHHTPLVTGKTWTLMETSPIALCRDDSTVGGADVWRIEKGEGPDQSAGQVQSGGSAY